MLKIMMQFRGKANIHVKADWITVISPYRHQMNMIKRQLEMCKGPLINTEGIRFATIDSIQGGENSIIIWDVTPANEHNPAQIGFLQDWRRVNIASTRAKDALWIVGNHTALESQINVLWKNKKERGPKNFAHLLVDVKDNFDLVNFNACHVLPRTLAEAKASPEHWSHEMEHMTLQESEFSQKYLIEERDQHAGNETILITSFSRSAIRCIGKPSNSTTRSLSINAT